MGTCTEASNESLVSGVHFWRVRTENSANTHMAPLFDDGLSVLPSSFPMLQAPVRGVAGSQSVALS